MRSSAEHPQNSGDIGLIRINHKGIYICKGFINPINRQVKLHDNLPIWPYLIVPKDFVDDSQSP